MRKELDYAALGLRIRHAREASNMTQEQLGEACNLSTAHIGHIERGSRIPSLGALFRIATELHVSLDFLVFDSVPENENFFIGLSAMLKGKVPGKVNTFLTAVRALADKIDEL